MCINAGMAGGVLVKLCLPCVRCNPPLNCTTSLYLSATAKSADAMYIIAQQLFKAQCSLYLACKLGQPCACARHCLHRKWEVADMVGKEVDVPRKVVPDGELYAGAPAKLRCGLLEDLRWTWFVPAARSELCSNSHTHLIQVRAQH